MIRLGKWGAKGKRRFVSIFALIICVNIGSIFIQSLFNYYAFHRMNRNAYLESFVNYNTRVVNLAVQNIDEQIIMPACKFAPVHFVTGGMSNPLTLPQEKMIKRSAAETRAVIAEMQNTERMYPYITNVDVYYEATQTAVTGFDKVHFLKDQEERDLYLPWYEEFEREGRPTGFFVSSKAAYLAEKPALTYIKTISNLKWKGKEIVLAIFIDSQGFKKYIDQEMGTFAVLTSDGKILYQTESQGELASPAFLSEIKRAGTEESAPFQSEDGVFWIFPYKSGSSGLTYLYAVENSKFYKDYESTGKMFQTNYLISIGFNLLLLALISYYNYSIYRRRVIKISENAGISIDDSNKSFDRSLDVLTGKISSLNVRLQSLQGLRFQSAVRSVILNRNIESGYEVIKPYLTGNYVKTFLIYLTEEKMENLSVEELQEDFLPDDKNYNVVFTTIDRDSLVAVVIFRREDGENVSGDFMEQMRVRWDKAVIISGAECALKGDGIRSSYRSAAAVSRYRFIFSDKESLSYEEIGLENRKASGSHQKLFDAIAKDLNGDNLPDLKDQIEMLVVSFQSGNYTIEYCMSTLGDLVSLLYQVMQNHHLDMWVVFGYDIREYFKQIPDIRRFHEWCDVICEMVLKNIHQNKAVIGVGIEDKMLRIIEENLENDNMSLEYLADQLHVRPDVASRMFRQIMGNGYGKYMKEQKLKRAIELMAEGMTVKDVTKRLGYSSSQYFIKIFKETYGVTPYQYNKKNGRKKEENI